MFGLTYAFSAGIVAWMYVIVSHGKAMSPPGALLGICVYTGIAFYMHRRLFVLKLDREPCLADDSDLAMWQVHVIEGKEYFLERMFWIYFLCPLILMCIFQACTT